MQTVDNTTPQKIASDSKVVANEKPKVKYGNLDKESECPFPNGFNETNDYLIKHWEVQLMNDNSMAVLQNSVDVSVYPLEDFQAHFKGYEKGDKTLFETVTGKKYKVLHDPTK